jgi:uncharacterized RDD family membrane protein YckC
MDRRFDPRSIVTPYAFAVHPDLLGMPLATPWQRLGAILLDLIVIWFISKVGGAPLAIASTLLLFWLATRKQSRDAFGKIRRIAVGCLGILVLLATTLVALWLRYGDDLERVLSEAESGIQIQGEGAPARDSLGFSGGELGILDLALGFRGIIELREAETPEEAQALITEVVADAYAAGLPRNEIRTIIADVIPEDADWAPEAGGMLDLAMANLVAQTGGPQGAGVEEESAGAEPGQGHTGLSPAALDSIAQLTRTIRRAEEDQADLERDLRAAREALEEEQNEGFMAWLLGIVDDLGIGFGWAAIYLTITHAWWKGVSIGKKIFGIRVVMIDKRPLNWWLSFERAGGYAAGFATGLLGFAQIFWDPNRQAIHDKVSETIVIQDGRKPVPGPWIEEGKAQWNRGRHGEGNNPGTR